VACIGVGPSAAQFIPQVARQAGHLTVFQRSPNYVVPRLDRPYTADEHRVFRAMPFQRDASRQAIYAEHESWHGAMRLDSRWLRDSPSWRGCSWSPGCGPGTAREALAGLPYRLQAHRRRR